MSRELTITASDFSYSGTTSKQESRYLSDFSSTPSNTFTGDWKVHKATLDVWMKSFLWLASGDVYIKIDNQTVGSMKQPGEGTWYSENILSYVNSQGDFGNITFSFSSSITKNVAFKNLSIYYIGLPYTLSLETSDKYRGTVDLQHNGTSDTSISLIATPKKGFKFSHWSDGSAANPYHYDPGSGVSNVALTANFVPIDYTIEYYDCTSGNEILYNTQSCSYDSSYNTLNFPSFAEIPIGYGINPVGWTMEKEANIRYGTKEIYLSDHKTIITQYTSFENLTTIDNDIIKMYFCLYPYSYEVNYIQYLNNSTENPTQLTTEYRIFNNGDYTLANLPASSKGYKLANQMQEQYGPVDTSLTNSWFTSNTNMNPGDPTISIVPSTYADNITLYSYEVLLNYIVNFYKFTLDGEEALEPKIWEYGITYNLPGLPTIEVIPEGYAVNPTGWVSSKSGSIRNNTSDMYSGTSTTTKLTQSTTCTKQPTTDQQVYNFYFGTYPVQYLVNYKKYTEGSSNNYTPDTDYRIYNLNNYTLKSLPDATVGYKLTNKMHNMGEQIDSTITNSWFTSSEAMQPGDPMITLIAADTAQDVTIYSFETPIDYEVYFHIYDYDGSEISSTNKWCKYKESLVMPSQFIDLPGRLPFGWYRGSQNIEDWRVLVNSDNETTASADIEISFNATVENLSDQDFDQVDLYTYYLPKTYLISYEWDDTYSQDLNKYKLPSSQEIIYGKNDYNIPIIPDYSNYIIDNVNTVNWYYYEHNNKNTPRLTNESLNVSKFLLENIIFYATRTPKPRYINFQSDNGCGTVEINSSTLNQDGYLENSILEVYAQPVSSDKAFLYWDDTKSRNPIRQILITDENANYRMWFRDESITKGIVDLYKGSTRLERAYIGDNVQFINQLYKYEEPTYTFKNISSTYKFTYDNTTGYYISGNAGYANSWSLCQIDINSKVRCLMHIDCINNAEPECDFGILSKLNQSLSDSTSKDTLEVSQIIFDTSDKHTDNIQTITYQIPKGLSSIQIKYRKDSKNNNNLDSLKFKIRFEEVQI